jgi:hypothetical protein
MAFFTVRTRTCDATRPAQREPTGRQRVHGGVASEPERSMDSLFGQRAATGKLIGYAGEITSITGYPAAGEGVGGSLGA